MHGVVFTSLREYLAAAHGDEVAGDVFGARGPFSAVESYPDEEFLELMQRATGVTRREQDALLHDFGLFTAMTTFNRLYPAFFAVASSAREFLLTVEARIHELVRATVPNAAPPKLHVSPVDEDVVAIEYTSERRLCVLLRGLVQGTASHFGEQAALDEKTCMHRGADACLFEVRLSPARPT